MLNGYYYLCVVCILSCVKKHIYDNKLMFLIHILSKTMDGFQITCLIRNNREISRSLCNEVCVSKN